MAGALTGLTAAVTTSVDVTDRGIVLHLATGPEVRMGEPLSVLALPDGAACAFYGAAYGELLRLMTAFFTCH